MKYWLKRLEWKIIKALGLQKKRFKTIEDVQSFNLKWFWMLIKIILVVYLAIIVGEGIAKLWLWFFPRIVRMPMIPV